MAPVTTLDIFKNVVLQADKIMKAQKKINPRFDQEIMGKLPAAIKDKDGPTIELYLAALKVALKDIEGSLDDIRLALSSLREIESTDEDFAAAHLQDIQKLVAKITEAQSSLTKQYETGKRLQPLAEKALDASRQTQEQAYQELAEFDKWAHDETKTFKDTFRQCDQIATRAQEAFDGRDGKALADAQKAIKALQIDSLAVGHDIHGKEIKEFLDGLNKRGFEADVVADMTKDANDTLSTHAGNKVYLDQMVRQQKMVMDFEIVAVDVKKAADALDLDSKAEPKLAKVLTGTRAAMEKGLDALAKELKLKTTGKQMVAVLEKAHLI